MRDITTQIVPLTNITINKNTWTPGNVSAAKDPTLDECGELIHAWITDGDSDSMNLNTEDVIICLRINISRTETSSKMLFLYEHIIAEANT